MKYTSVNNGWLLRLSMGDKLIESLLEFAKSQQTSGAWINGLGAASIIEIGYYDLETKDYTWQKYSSVEILSLQGNLTWLKDGPTVHMHGVFSDKTMNTIGGHVKELTVSATCEIYITEFQITDKIYRLHDDQTGLSLLYI